MCQKVKLCVLSLLVLTRMATGVTLFHAGTAIRDGQLVTAGGRVLGVTAVADDLRQAVDLAYEGVQSVSWEGMYYRKDIAHRYGVSSLCFCITAQYAFI